MKEKCVSHSNYIIAFFLPLFVCLFLNDSMFVTNVIFGDTYVTMMWEVSYMLYFKHLNNFVYDIALFFSQVSGQLVSQPSHIFLLKFLPMPFLIHCWSLQKSFWQGASAYTAEVLKLGRQAAVKWMKWVKSFFHLSEQFWLTALQTAVL